MKALNGTYVHRGDRLRRRRAYKQLALAASFFATIGLLLGNRHPVAVPAEAAAVSTNRAFRIDFSTNKTVANQLDSARGELDLMHSQLDRANKVIGYSSQFGIAAGLAASIMDVANAEGIDPDLAFRLVKLESDFNTHATSPVGAIGLTQVMPSTARFYQRGITTQKLYDPTVNLRIGLHYLRELIEEYHGNTNLALLVYNRGPAAVAKSQANGDNPSNGYDRILTKGYRGKGTIN